MLWDETHCDFPNSVFMESRVLTASAIGLVYGSVHGTAVVVLLLNCMLGN